MQLSKPKFFSDRKNFLIVIGILLSIVLLRVLIEYQTYKEFISKPFYYTYAEVLISYEKTKGNRRYKVLKLRSDDGLVFYTTSYQKEDFNHQRLRLQIFPDKNIDFKDYLSTFYVRSKIKQQEKLPLTFKDELLKKVNLQHNNSTLGSFYNAIFFATHLDRDLREKINMLGISHLVALSGFHLSILWGFVYGLLLLFYRPFQQYFFPYRHALFDVGLITIVVLAAYLWFVDFPPSLVRSYAMLLVGWMMLLLGMELLSFTFLTTIMLALVALFPFLLVSLSFLLSVAGVFYIFLLLQYTKNFNKWIVSLLFIPVGIFILMLPVVHSIFPVTSGYQLLSPLLSILFVFFYPFSIFLHFLDFGAFFDLILLNLFSAPQDSREVLLPLWAMSAYVIFSLGAIWSKIVFFILCSVATLYMVYLFMPIEQITKF